MRLALVLVTLAILATRVPARGTVKGWAVDRHGGALPGVSILAVPVAGPGVRVVTDSTGHYELGDLPAGTYDVKARLSGFFESTRKGVGVSDGSMTGQVNFVLCAVMEELDWPSTSLAGLWRLADVVLRLRVSATGRVHTGCDEEDFEHTGAVIEVFKNNGRLEVGRRLSFAQENWSGERAPYAIGQDMVLFLTATPLGFRRAAGPQAVLLLKGSGSDDVLQAIRRLGTGRESD